MKANPRTLNDLIIEHKVDEANIEVVQEIDTNLIKTNPDQPRKFFDVDKIEELALSIKQHGLLQPIILKKVNEEYVIIAGERRFQACLQLNLKKIPSIIRQIQDKKIPEISLIENIQREDLNIIEEAKAYRDIIEKYGYKQHELALKVGKSRSHIVNILGLLRLPEEVLKMVEKNVISMGHARAISKLENKDLMIKNANLVILKDLSVRELENLLNKNKMKREISSVQIKNDLDQVEKLSYETNNEGTSIIVKGSKSQISKITSYVREMQNLK